MDILELPWWAYVSFSIGFFMVCLALNYAVKKMNEAKMRERLVRVLVKTSATQCTHVNGPVITVSSEGEPRVNSVRPPQQPYSPPAISLVFDKEENRRIGDVYNLVKPLTDWTFGDPSINTNKSQETINVLAIPSDRTVNEPTPIKKIECELVTAKATSSHKFFEKVLIKDKIGSCNPTNLITPKNYSFSEIPGIAGSPFSQKDCNTNSVTTKEPGRIITGGTTPSDPKHTVAESNPFINIGASRMVSTKTCIVETTGKNTKVMRDKESREKNDTGCLNSIMSKIANLKNIDDNLRIEKSATNMIFAKSSSSNSGSIRNVTKITSIENKESSCIAAKESSQTHSKRLGENIPVKTSKSEQIFPKETSFDARNENHLREYVSIRNNVMNSSSNERSHYNDIESVLIKNTECRPLPAKASYKDEIDSYDLPVLVTLKNHSFEKIPGILPFTGKDLYTSKLISESESVFSNSDVSATEKSAEESRRTKSEGTTSNEPNNSAAENIPFKNIVSGRIFPTNTFITEIAAKNPKVLRDKKSNEEIDTSCLDGLMSKIAIFKSMNDDTRIEKSATGSNRNVIKISSVEKKECSCIAAKAISSLTHCDREEQNISLTTSEYIVPKETSPDTQFKQHVKEFASIRNSVKNECRRIELKKTSSNERSSSNVTEYVPIKTSEPGRIVARQTALLTRSDTNVIVFGHALENAAERIVAEHIVAEATPSHTQSPIRMSEFGFLAAKKTSNRQSDDNVPDTNIVQLDRATPPNTQSEIIISKDDSIKTTESGSINVKETSNRLTEINVPDTNIVQMDVSRRTGTAVKEESLIISSNNATEYVTIQTSESGSIVARETASLTLSGPDVLNPIKMSESGSIATKDIYNTQSKTTAVKEESLRELVSANNATESVTIETSGSGSIVARETASLTLIGPNVLKLFKMSESGSIAVKEISNRQIEDNVLDTNVIQLDESEPDLDVLLLKKKLREF